MANISLAGFIGQKRRAFRTVGIDLVRFESDVIDAINRACRRINRDADLETRITYVNQGDTTIALDEDYEDVLSDAVDINLIDMGSRPAKGFEVPYTEAKRALPEQIDSIRSDILNRAVEADTDDETSFVGVGAQNA